MCRIMRILPCITAAAGAIPGCVPQETGSHSAGFVQLAEQLIRSTDIRAGWQNRHAGCAALVRSHDGCESCFVSVVECR